MPNLHPVVVHFPIVLFSISFLFDTMSVVLKRDQFEFAGRWTQLLGALSLVVVLLSGLAAKSSVTIPEIGKYCFELHEQTAFLVVAAASFLILWRVSNRLLLPTRNRTLFLIVSFLVVALIWIGAWFGGELVYTFGVGVHSVTN